jgi:pilus assembly protein Flp/PilA
MVDLPPQLRELVLLVTFGLRRRQDERGASAVEYGLLVAGIAAVIVAAVFLFGEGIFSKLFQETCNSIGQNMNNAC